MEIFIIRFYEALPTDNYISMKYLFLLPLTLFFTFSGCSLLNGDDDINIPGKIVFSADDGEGNSQIYTMNANGTSVKKLTDFPPEGEAIQPSWSPDGQKIIFSSFQRGSSLGPALWVMDADGSNKHVLYDPEPDNPDNLPLAGKNARWSPDGTKVAFDICLNCQVETNYDIFVFDITTKQLTQLTEHSGSDTNPTWSPDGSQIAFSSNRDYVNADSVRWRKDLYKISINKDNLQRLTETGNATMPRWSPEGSKVAFEWNIQENEIFTYDLADRKIRNIKAGLQFSGNPLWNKKGDQLLIFGRETENSQPKMRLLQIQDEKIKPLDEITLNKVGRNYDWCLN